MICRRLRDTLDAPAFEATESQKGAKYQYIEQLAALLGLTERLPDCRYSVITSITLMLTLFTLLIG